MPTGPCLCLFQMLSKYFKPNTQEFGLEIHSREVTKTTTAEVVLLHATRLLVLIYASTKYYQNIQTIKKSLSAQDFDLEMYSVECTKKRTKQELPFLHVTPLLDLIYVQPKYYQIILDSMGVIACTRFQLQGR